MWEMVPLGRLSMKLREDAGDTSALPAMSCSALGLLSWLCSSTRASMTLLKETRACNALAVASQQCGQLDALSGVQGNRRHPGPVLRKHWHVLSCAGPPGWAHLSHSASAHAKQQWLCAEEVSSSWLHPEGLFDPAGMTVTW